MIDTIKLTSKRQATLPARLCRELGVKPGDELALERRSVDGHDAWLLSRPQADPAPWFGCLRAYAAGKSHDMESIRANIARRRVTT